MVAGILNNHMAIIGLQEQWHAYEQIQEYQGIKQIILFQLRTNATWLFDSDVDEQLIMERMGHLSCEGVRSYKHVPVRRNLKNFQTF